MIQFRADFFFNLVFMVVILMSMEAQGQEETETDGELKVGWGGATAWFEGSGIQARIRFSPNPRGGGGAKVSMVITGLTQGFANAYHIHQLKIDDTKSCASAGPHFNPTNAPVGSCDPQQPQLCEVGDLAGKHGKISPSSDAGRYRTSYIDPSLELTHSETGILYRSVVIHGVGTTRIACGTIYPDSHVEYDF